MIGEDWVSHASHGFLTVLPPIPSPLVSHLILPGRVPLSSPPLPGLQTVSHCWLDRRVRESDYLMREGDIDKSQTLNELILAGGLCNMCKYEDTPNAVSVPLPAVSNTLRAATNVHNT